MRSSATALPHPARVSRARAPVRHDGRRARAPGNRRRCRGRRRRPRRRSDGAVRSRGASEQSSWVKAKSYKSSSRAVSLVGVMSSDGVRMPCDRSGCLVGVVMLILSNNANAKPENAVQNRSARLPFLDQPPCPPWTTPPGKSRSPATPKGKSPYLGKRQKQLKGAPIRRIGGLLGLLRAPSVSHNSWLARQRVPAPSAPAVSVPLPAWETVCG